MRLSPLLVMMNRDLIPTFASTVVQDPSKAIERSWKEILDSVTLSQLDPDVFRNKRAIFFGEQHHQPQVLRAQMQILKTLHASRTSQGSRLVMVLEHFNHEQDALLAKFSRYDLSNDDLLSEYAKSNEGFNLHHYLPLLMLARELEVPIYGGFPPRPWASIVYKASIGALRDDPAVCIPPTFGDSRWLDVSEISSYQIAYLQSMMSGNAPNMTDPNGERRIHFDSGILPAQALKDTFFAWSIDKHLATPDTTVYAVCGLGHSEYNLCTTPRLRSCSSNQILTIASKDWQSTEFSGDETTRSTDNILADIIIPYEDDSEA